MLNRIKTINHFRRGLLNRFYTEKAEAEVSKKIVSSKSKTMRNGETTPVKQVKVVKQIAKTTETNKVLKLVQELIPAKEYSVNLENILRKLADRKPFILTLGYEVKKGKTIYLSINITENGTIAAHSEVIIETAKQLQDYFKKLTFH